MAATDDRGVLRSGESIEVPTDNIKLMETSGAFRRACKIVGGAPTTMFRPILNECMDCLSGMQPMEILDSTCIFMLFFTALFLDTEILLNYIVFDLIDKNTCVDILGLVSKLKKRDDFFSKSIINYFRSEFKMDPDYVYLSLARNPRKLRWEISKFSGDNHKLNRISKFPSTCKICKVTMNDADHLSMTRKCIHTVCCMQSLHIKCMKKIMEQQWGYCPYCRSPFTKGVIEPLGDLAEVVQVSVVRANGAPPPSQLVRGEVFRFLDSPYESRNINGPMRTAHRRAR